jgi:DNA-binding transcriptional MocR family regulator
MITILLDHISLASGRKYRQIASGIQAAIAAGSLQPGDRLPPQRELADALGVTLGTVTRAYRQIDELGLSKARSAGGPMSPGAKSRISPSMPSTTGRIGRLSIVFVSI